MEGSHCLSDPILDGKMLTLNKNDDDDGDDDQFIQKLYSCFLSASKSHLALIYHPQYGGIYAVLLLYLNQVSSS